MGASFCKECGVVSAEIKPGERCDECESYFEKEGESDEKEL